MPSLVREQGTYRVVTDQPGVWQCKCGSQLFFLHDDGTVECSRCCNFHASIRWNKVAHATT